MKWLHVLGDWWLLLHFLIIADGGSPYLLETVRNSSTNMRYNFHYSNRRKVSTLTTEKTLQEAEFAYDKLSFTFFGTFPTFAASFVW